MEENLTNNEDNEALSDSSTEDSHQNSVFMMNNSDFSARGEDLVDLPQSNGHSRRWEDYVSRLPYNSFSLVELMFALVDIYDSLMDDEGSTASGGRDPLSQNNDDIWDMWKCDELLVASLKFKKRLGKERVRNSNFNLNHSVISQEEDNLVMDNLVSINHIKDIDIAHRRRNHIDGSINRNIDFDQHQIQFTYSHTGQDGTPSDSIIAPSGSYYSSNANSPIPLGFHNNVSIVDTHFMYNFGHFSESTNQNICFTSSQQRFAESQQRFAASQQQFAASQQRFAASQQRVAASQQRVAASQQRVAASQQGFAASQQQFAASQQRFAASQQRIAASQQGFAVSQQQFAASQQRVAASQQGFAASQQRFAAPQQGFAASQQRFAAPQQGFAASQQRFAAPQQRFAASAVNVAEDDEKNEENE